MKKRVARHVVATAIRTSSSLSAALSLYKRYCSPEEFEELQLAIANSAAEVSLNLITPLLKAHPDLQIEIDEEIDELGKVL